MRWQCVALVLWGAWAWPRPAEACGGCFQPAGEVSVLSAHRMAVSVSPGETVLWDQIQYTGNPEEFVWMLPIGSDAVVELADPGFFEALSRETVITLRAPAVFCPCCVGAASDGTLTPVALEAGPLAVGMPMDPDAMAAAILYRAVVGPYETVTVQGTGDEVIQWLVTHGYAVPEATRPVLSHYAELGLSFVVLRLRPGVGIDQMQPVRVRMPGVSLSLPLRMVAAGAGDTIDLELFVIAEGRMEAASFGNAEVARAALEYDANGGRFDYDELFEEALFQGVGETTNWVTESASAMPVDLLASYEATGPDGDVHRAGTDVAVAIDGISSPYLTRLRTRLQRSDLERDLTLRASSGAYVGREVDAVVVNLPPCALPGDAGPRRDAGLGARPERRRACGCAVPARATGPTPVTFAVGVIFALLTLRLRGRTKRP